MVRRRQVEGSARPARTLCALLAAGLVALLASACSGSSAVLVAPLDPTIEHVAAMALPQGALGPQGDGLELDRASGYVDNRAAAAAFLDPTVSSRDLAALGRKSGYRLVYAAPGGSTAAGVRTVGTAVHLFDSAASVDRYLAGRIDDAQGNPPDPSRAEHLPLPDVGDRAGLLHIRGNIALPGHDHNSTLAYFRIGHLLAEVELTHVDPFTHDADVVALATTLEARMTAILDRSAVAGPPPVPLPLASVERCDATTPGVCLLPLDGFSPTALAALVSYLEVEAGVDVGVLPALPVDPRGFRSGGQLDADAALTQARSTYVSAAAGDNVTLIALTDHDLAGDDPDRPFVFGLVDHGSALVSTARLDPAFFDFPRDDELVDARTRKLVAHIVATEHLDMRPSDDPHSLLYDAIVSAADLDRMCEHPLRADPAEDCADDDA